jgi:hypothetical protein
VSGFLTDISGFLDGESVNTMMSPSAKIKGVYKNYYVNKLRKTGICISL